MSKKQEIVPKEEAEAEVSETAVALTSNSAEALIGQAIQKGVPVETMERLLTMRRELKSEFAKEEFNRSMAEFQGECPIIQKTKAGGQTKMGQVAYYYAPLESIVLQTKDLIKKHGFSYAVQTATNAGSVKVTCRVTHSAGHSETNDVEVPLGTKTGVMSDSQVVASALTFAKRYAFCNAFGILTGDQDDDANSTKAKSVDDKVGAILEKIAKDTRVEAMQKFNEQVQKSEKYTAGQKSEIGTAIKNRLAELEIAVQAIQVEDAPQTPKWRKPNVVASPVPLV